jgi:NAD(P)-dependent dehydrogenase (short-subunit alcohol dehydrogenase family)
VAIVSRIEANLKAALRDLAALARALIAVPCDLTRSDAAVWMVTEVERRLGSWMLVNSAGAKALFAEDLNADSWHEGMDAKYFPIFIQCRLCYPGWRKGRCHQYWD